MRLSGMQRLPLQGTVIGVRWAASLLPKPCPGLLDGLCHVDQPKRYQSALSARSCVKIPLYQLLLPKDPATQAQLLVKAVFVPTAGVSVMLKLDGTVAWIASGQQVLEKPLLSLKPP